MQRASHTFPKLEPVQEAMDSRPSSPASTTAEPLSPHQLGASGLLSLENPAATREKPRGSHLLVAFRKGALLSRTKLGRGEGEKIA